MNKFIVIIMVSIITSLSLAGCSQTEEEKKVAELIEKMQNGILEDHDAAVNEFVEMDEDAVDPLIEALNNSDERVRCGAAKALGKLEYIDAVEPLIEVLDDKGQFKISLGKSRSFTVSVYKCAADALAQIGDESAVEPLIEMLQDRDVDRRVAAAEALGNLGDERAIEPLIEALNHRNSEICFIMAESLRNITGVYLDDEYASWKEWYEQEA